MPEVVDLRGLRVAYGKITALAGIDLRIENGATGLLGPNGAGKSSLLKAVLGLVKPAAGTIRVLGVDARRHPLQVRRRVGYMPERDACIPGMSGLEFVTHCGRLTGMSRIDARRRAHEVIEYASLGEARYRDVEGYSRGMRQRVKLAQALVHDPDLIMLDEPTNGLDPKGRAEILRLIRHIAVDRGIHVLLSSHLLHDVELVCDQVVVLAQGSVRAAGDLQGLRQRDGASRYRIRIKGDSRRLVASLEARGAGCQVDEQGSILACLPAGAEPRLVFEQARAAGVQVRGLVPLEESLEEIFMRSLEGNG